MTVVVVGSVGIDDVETPFGKAESVVGGSAVYFSLADVLQGRGADLSGLKVFDDQPTFRWSGRYEGDMNAAETLNTELNVLATPPATPDAFRGAPFVFLANMGPDVQLNMLEELQGGEVFADTMNLWIDTQRDELGEVMRRVDGMILNDGEARMLTGETNLIRAGEALLDMGPRVVVVKKGEHGAFLFEDSFHFALPAYPTSKVVDPTGAGDSFAGGFLGYLAEKGNSKPAVLRHAMAYGTVAASLTVERFSTEGLVDADREAVDGRFKELHEFIRL
jgi:sugar/nucleoside kinase (ribokinase family)